MMKRADLDLGRRGARERGAARCVKWSNIESGPLANVSILRYAFRQPDKSRSILKIERDNYDPETGKQRQVYCLGIASKRYAFPPR
jgi:hypothetical protein